MNDQALRWPLLSPLALGAAAYMKAPDEPGWWVLGVAASAPSLAWLLLRRRGAGLLALAISLRSLAIVLAAVVLLQLEAVVMPGFQMSFAASGALIALYEMWPRLERADRPGVFSRIGVWFLAAEPTSFIASFAMLPFALHNFDHAALFSLIANIVSMPVMSLATTPAAALAAIAAPFGLADPFLWLMGQSLELVLTIAEISVAILPDVDLPRLDTLGVALAAVAIGLMCLLHGRGRIFRACASYGGCGGLAGRAAGRGLY